MPPEGGQRDEPSASLVFLHGERFYPRSTLPKGSLEDLRRGGNKCGGKHAHMLNKCGVKHVHMLSTAPQPHR